MKEHEREELEPVWKKISMLNRSSFVNLDFFTWPVLIAVSSVETDDDEAEKKR